MGRTELARVRARGPKTRGQNPRQVGTAAGDEGGLFEGRRSPN